MRPSKRHTLCTGGREVTPGFSPGQRAHTLPSEPGFSPARPAANSSASALGLKPPAFVAEQSPRASARGKAPTPSCPSRASARRGQPRNSGIFRTVALLLLLGTLSLTQHAAAQGVSKVGTTAADFLQIDVGPRAVAMGGAFVAGVDDASALYWNPAGIAHMRGSEMIASHTEWLADLTFDYLGVGLDFGNAGVAGVSVTMLSVPDMIVRTVDRQDGTGETFDAADMALGVSYGRAVTDRFSIGVTAKYIRQRIWHSEATGFALDIGTQFRTDFVGGLTIGAVMSNFGSDMKLNGRDLRTFVDPDPSQLGNNNRVPANFELDAAKLPLNFQFGITTTPVNSRLHKVTLNADALHPNSNNESLNLGIEYGYQERVFLRGGYRGMLLDEAEGGLSGGLGVHQTLFEGGVAKLDYAFRAGGRLGDVHVVGFGLTF